MNGMIFLIKRCDNCYTRCTWPLDPVCDMTWLAKVQILCDKNCCNITLNMWILKINFIYYHFSTQLEKKNNKLWPILLLAFQLLNIQYWYICPSYQLESYTVASLYSKGLTSFICGFIHSHSQDIRIQLNRK